MKCNSYGRMLKRISTELSPHEQATVKRIFCWLICARRPLRTVELEHALLIQPGDKELQHTRALYKDVLELCGPIVEKRKEYITFIHFSAKEYSHAQTFTEPLYKMLTILSRYLTKNSPGDIRKAESHAEVAVTCLSYLRFRYFDGDTTDDEVDGFIATGGYVLHQYSQSNFVHHVRGAWRDLGGASEILRASTGEFLEARWNPIFSHVDSEQPPRSSTLEYIQSMDLEDYKKLNAIATYLRTLEGDLQGSTKGLSLLCIRVVDCWGMCSRLTHVRRRAPRAVAFNRHVPSYRGSFRYPGLKTLLSRGT